MHVKWGVVAVIALAIAMMLVTIALSGCPKAEEPPVMQGDPGMIEPGMEDPDVAPPTADDVEGAVEGAVEGVEGAVDGAVDAVEGAVDEATNAAPASPEDEPVPPPAG